jgi:hypothetical protein
MKFVTLAYGVACYVVFFLTFLHLIVFVGGDMTAIAGAPKTLDYGPVAAEFAPPALHNLMLLLLFGASHSVMARPGFKRG